MFEHSKNVVGLSLFMITAFWVAVNFFFIVVNGQTVIGQESLALNIGEFVFSLGVLGLAIERYVSYIRKIRCQKHIKNSLSVGSS